MKAYGAEIVLTDGKKGMTGSIEKAQELARESIQIALFRVNFENPANPLAHVKTTGPEIWADTDGKVDIFVAGVGTGGTVSGVGTYLKSKNPGVKIVGVEPETLSGYYGKQSLVPILLQGIGAGFIPKKL